MNFKDLREADLSKAQIKKVHDKADEMPKSDFIKRYGKDGDSVRFATATNMVKKQLNIEALDKEDEKSIGDVVKGLKKAVKSHQAQVKSLTKDIQDQVSNEGGPGSGPQHGEITITKNGKSKKVKRPALSIFKKAGWKQEEVELDEVHFSNRGETPAPKGMHKLRSGRDIPSSPQVDKIHNKIVLMTDMNDHFGARIEIAKQVGDKQLVQVFSSLKLIHDKYSSVVGNQAIELRSKFAPVLNKAIDRKFGKYADVIRDGL